MMPAGIPEMLSLELKDLSGRHLVKWAHLANVTRTRTAESHSTIGGLEIDYVAHIATVCRLGPADTTLLRKLNALFGEAFHDRETYDGVPPTNAYLQGLLAKGQVIALVAIEREKLIGGLVAYEFDKFERMRREIYIYDLAVNAAYRRRGVATALIEHLREIAAQRRAWVIYVQADYGDESAIALYEKLGIREDVIHFDINIEVGTSQRATQQWRRS
jgi:aminoglycoside 3-N-acetyltransferase I